MSEPELVEAYLEGKIVTWTFVRRLLKVGLTVGTALAFTALLPAAAESGETTALEQLVEQTAKRKPDEAKVLARLMDRLAQSLLKIRRGGSERQLGRVLGRLSLNAANTGRSALDLNFNDTIRRVPINLSGNLLSIGENIPDAAPELAAVAPGEQNFAVTLAGQVGKLPLNLNGFVEVNVNGRRGPRGVNLNVQGNLGSMPIAINRGQRDPG